MAVLLLVTSRSFSSMSILVHWILGFGPKCSVRFRLLYKFEFFRVLGAETVDGGLRVRLLVVGFFTFQTISTS